MALEHQNIVVGEATALDAAVVTQDTWRDALLDHASGAWTLEEEFDSSGTSMHYVVIKNSDAISDLGVDFFVIIARRTSDGYIGVMVAEEYVAAANQMAKYVPRSDGTFYIITDGTIGNPTALTYTLGTAFPTSAPDPVCPTVAPAATERLITCVDDDYAILNVNGNSFYVGGMVDLIEPMTGIVATPAVACVHLNQGTAGPHGGVTRQPIASADAPLQLYYPFALTPFLALPYMAATFMQLQEMQTAMYLNEDRFHNNRVVASEIAGIQFSTYQSSYAGNSAKKSGALRSKYKGVRVTTGPAAAVNYDSIVVDGNKADIIYAMGSLSGFSPYMYMPNPYGAGSVQLMIVADTGVPA